ncbi:MAG: transketolase [Candidatus Omnitrophota bacterium]
MKSPLLAKANAMRDEVLRVALKNKAGHIAPSLSSVDILVALYYGVLACDPKNPQWADRDRVVFSKAHGCYALYAILADIGMLPQKEWENFYTSESTLLGCMERRAEYGLEASCGSLGHGLPMAVGIAYGAKLQKKSYQTYCVIGDGEFQEGSVWEAILFAVKHKMDNLTIIVDHNRLQAMDHIRNVLDRDEKELVRRLKGFGLSPLICPGHDVQEIAECIRTVQKDSSPIPRAIIAETVKGFGLKCMENVPKFHFRIPSDDELAMGKSYG